MEKPMWNRLLTHDNFSLAWRRIRNSSATTTKDRLGLNIFSQALDIHITKLIEEIESGTYEAVSPSLLYVPKRSKRLRPFTLLHMRDRLVYQAIGNILIENVYDDLKDEADLKVFSPVLIGKDKDYIFYPSLRKGDEFEGQFLKFMQKQKNIIESGKYSWIVEADISSFFPSIDHSLLIRKIKDNGWLNSEIAMLLQNCLHIWSADSPKLQINKGLPIGYETSELLANLFLKDLSDHLEDQEYLRYVDDIRIYTTAEDKGYEILNQLDIFLQNRGLTLQESKLKIRRLDDGYLEDQIEKLEDQQILLSTIDRDINSPDQIIQEDTDKKLRNLLIEILGIEEWDALHPEEQTDLTEEAPFFFALYRIREKNIQLRNVALDLLSSHPHRSYAIIHYLTLFYGDQEVIRKLWNIVDDESKHAQVRAHSLKALYILTGNSDEIKRTIQNWLYKPDLSLSLCAIELIQQYPDGIELLDLTKLGNDHTDQHFLYSAISTKFILTESDNEKLSLISQCISQKDYVLNTLGVYFLSTNLHLLSELPSNISGLANDLIQNIQNNVSAETLQNMQKLFSIEHMPDLSKGVISTLTNLNQYIVNMIFSKETNRDEYLRNLAEFLKVFSQIYQKITSKEFTSIAQTSTLQEAFGYTRNGLANLSDFRSSVTFIGTKPALGYIDTEKLHEGISKIIEQALKALELIRDIEAPIESILSSTSSSLPLIFFSYSHDDEHWRNELAKKLKYLETHGLATLWSDRKIPAGQVWNEELNEKLNESDIVLFLTTSQFMGSSFIHEEEMPRAIENYKNKKTICIPIIFEDCDWKFWPYQHLQAIPNDAKAITLWHHPDSAYKDIQENIRNALETIKNGTHLWRELPPKS